MLYFQVVEGYGHPLFMRGGECIGVCRRVQKEKKNVILKPFFLILPLLNVHIYCILYQISIYTKMYVHKYIYIYAHSYSYNRYS